MLDDPPAASLTTCALTYTWSPSVPLAVVAIQNISTDLSLLDDIRKGYKSDEFTRQLTKDIRAGSINGAKWNMACYMLAFDIVALSFIGPLPEEDGKDTILTITDLLRADIHIIATHSSYTTLQVATILFNDWYCENGLMLQLISDQDPLFTSEVWTALHKLTGIKLNMSTAYHSQTNGSSEHTNKTVNQALSYHVNNNQKGWSKTLPCICFAIMNTTIPTTHSPLIPHTVVPTPTPADIEAQQIIDKLQTNICKAHDCLLAAKIRWAYHANLHQGPEEVYAVRDLVMLSTEHCQHNYKCKGKKHVAKFMPRHDGPYTIICTFPEKSEYTLHLPNNPQTFPGFHTSLLKCWIPNDLTKFPDRELMLPSAITTADGTKENFINKIVNCRCQG
ncbi:hypothetical protein M422DRAFT_253298 [Sphaerobolus stellatus SS14]|uniref:Integrase catalytic domain-containing protein n=1 Tax=Sphaerobolus stellatus (strain SS14) TaxID=990650 RepID=A0A0C9UK81_SPHS4|nr:hypothetical protein M422DRAFT_253298 [Sphaerobolus stellatus SS14]